MPDPNLQAAMEEIKEVLRRRDIGASIVLASKTNTEYLREFSPRWSLVKMEPLPDGAVRFRLRAKREDFPSREEHETAVRDSVGLLMGIYDTLRIETGIMEKIIKVVALQVDFTHVTRAEPPL